MDEDYIEFLPAGQRDIVRGLMDLDAPEPIADADVPQTQAQTQAQTPDASTAVADDVDPELRAEMARLEAIDYKPFDIRDMFPDLTPSDIRYLNDRAGTEVGLGEALSDLGLKDMPFLETGYSLSEVYKTVEASAKIQAGMSSRDDQLRVAQFMIDGQRDSTFMGGVASFARSMAPSMGELLVSGGVFNVAKGGAKALAKSAAKEVTEEIVETAAAKAAKESAFKAFERSARKRLHDAVANKIVRSSADALGTATTYATARQFVPKVLGVVGLNESGGGAWDLNQAREVWPDWEMTDEEAREIAIGNTEMLADMFDRKSSASGFVEELVRGTVEQAGGALTRIPGIHYLQALQTKMLRKTFGKLGPKAYRRIMRTQGWKKGYYDGPLAEMLEEVASEIAVEGVLKGNFIDSLPDDIEELAQMYVGAMIPGMGMAGIGGLRARTRAAARMKLRAAEEQRSMLKADKSAMGQVVAIKGGENDGFSGTVIGVTQVESDPDGLVEGGDSLTIRGDDGEVRTVSLEDARAIPAGGDTSAGAAPTAGTAGGAAPLTQRARESVAERFSGEASRMGKRRVKGTVVDKPRSRMEELVINWARRNFRGAEPVLVAGDFGDGAPLGRAYGGAVAIRVPQEPTAYDETLDLTDPNTPFGAVVEELFHEAELAMGPEAAQDLMGALEALGKENVDNARQAWRRSTKLRNPSQETEDMETRGTLARQLSGAVYYLSTPKGAREFAELEKNDPGRFKSILNALQDFVARLIPIIPPSLRTRVQRDLGVNRTELQQADRMLQFIQQAPALIAQTAQTPAAAPAQQTQVEADVAAAEAAAEQSGEPLSEAEADRQIEAIEDEMIERLRTEKDKYREDYRKLTRRNRRARNARKRKGKDRRAPMPGDRVVIPEEKGAANRKGGGPVPEGLTGVVVETTGSGENVRHKILLDAGQTKLDGPQANKEDRLTRMARTRPDIKRDGRHVIVDRADVQITERLPESQVDPTSKRAKLRRKAERQMDEGAEPLFAMPLADSMGFNSPSLTALSRVTVGTLRASTVRKSLEKLGASAAEWKWMGMDDALKPYGPNDRIPVSVLRRMMDERRVEVTENILDQEFRPAEEREAADARAREDMYADLRPGLELMTNGNLSTIVSGMTVIADNVDPADADLELALTDYVLAAPQSELMKYYPEGYSPLAPVERRREFRDSRHWLYELRETNAFVTPGEAIDQREVLLRIETNPLSPDSQQFLTSNYKTFPNTLGHALTSFRVLEDGRAVLYIDDVRSEWGERLSRGENVRPHPFEGKEHKLLLNRLVQQAAEQKFDAVALAPAWIHGDRYRAPVVEGLVWTTTTAAGYKNVREVTGLVLRGRDDRLTSKFERLLYEVDTDIVNSTVTNKTSGAEVFPPKLREQLRNNRSGELAEDSLTVLGDNEMQRMHGEVIPEAVAAIGRRWGSELETASLDMGEMGVNSVQVLPITDEMVENAESVGESLYAMPLDQQAIDEIGLTAPVFVANNSYAEGAPLLAMMDRVRTFFQDEFLPVQRMVEAAVKAGAIMQDSPIKSIRTYFGRVGDGHEMIDRNFLQPLRAVLSGAKISLAEAANYKLNLHTEEANERFVEQYERRQDLVQRIAALREAMKGETFDRKLVQAERALVEELKQLNHVRYNIPEGRDAREYIHEVIKPSGKATSKAKEELAEVHASPNADAYRESAAIVKKMNDAALKMAFDAGLLTEEMYDEYSNRYQNYVPLKTDVDTGFDFPSRGRGFFLGAGAEYKKRKGRKDEADDVISFSISQALRTVERAEKNKTAQDFYRFAASNQSTLGLQVQEATEEEYQADLRRDVDSTKFYVKVEGKPMRIDVGDRKVADALRRVNVYSLPAAMRAYSKIAMGWRNLVTTFSPEFVWTNMMRDVQTAIAQSASVEADLRAEGYRGVQNLKSEIRSRLNTSRRAILDFQRQGKDSTGKLDRVRRFSAAGGRIGGVTSSDFKEIQRRFEKKLEMDARTGPLGTGQRGIVALAELIEDQNQSVETMARFALFDALVDQGVSDADAAHAARQLTTDFSQKGEAGHLLSQFYIFFSASIGGNARLMKELGGPEGRALAMRLAAYGLTSAYLNEFLSDDDDDGLSQYSKMSEWEKARNHILMIPGFGPLKIPMPYGWSVFPAIGRLAAEFSMGHKTATQALKDVFYNVLDSTNPLGASPTWSQLVAPTFADPFVQSGTNTNFMGGPVRRPQDPYGPELANHERSFRNTTAAAKEVARWINKLTGGGDVEPGWLNPGGEDVELFYEFFSGGTGRFISNMVKTTRNVVTGQLDRDSLFEAPFLRTMLGSRTEMTDVGRFYEARNEFMMAEAMIEHAQEKGDAKEYNRLMKRWGNVLTLAKSWKSTHEQSKRLLDAAHDTKWWQKANSKRIEQANKLRQQWVSQYMRAVGRATIDGYVSPFD